LNVRKQSSPPRSPWGGIEICILAGGLGTRIGLDKARLRLGTRSLLGHSRALARAVGKVARVVRHDLVRRSGPIGGVCTALLTTRADAVLFLSCDMPFVRPEIVRVLLRQARRTKEAVFVKSGGVVGFPFVIRRSALIVVLRRVVDQHLSLQGLAASLKSTYVRPLHRQANALFNINTPEELKLARRIQRSRDRPSSTRFHRGR